MLDGYLDALGARAKLKTLVKSGAIAQNQQAAAREQFNHYDRALGRASTALTAWDHSVAGTENARLVTKPLRKLQEMQEQMRGTADRLLK